MLAGDSADNVNHRNYYERICIMVKSKNEDQSKKAIKLEPWVVRVIGLVICLIVGLFLWKEAFAQSDDWIRPAVDIIDSLILGIRLFAGGLMGAGVLIIAIQAFTTGNINWSWAISLIAGGIMIALGQVAITTLIGL